MTEVVLSIVITLVAMIVLPIFAYLIAKYWEIGKLKGRDTYRQYKRERQQKRDRPDLDDTLGLLRTLGKQI